MPFSEMDTINDVNTPDNPGSGGGGGTANDDNNGNVAKSDDGPQVWPGENTDVDGADIATPSLGWSPFASIGGVGLNLPSFTFGGSSSGSGGALKPAGILLIIAALAGAGYYLYKKYKK